MEASQPGSEDACRLGLRSWPDFSAEALPSCKFGLFIAERNPMESRSLVLGSRFTSIAITNG
jgi:hypothetical protein